MRHRVRVPVVVAVLATMMVVAATAGAGVASALSQSPPPGCAVLLHTPVWIVVDTFDNNFISDNCRIDSGF